MLCLVLFIVLSCVESLRGPCNDLEFHNAFSLHRQYTNSVNSFDQHIIPAQTFLADLLAIFEEV